MLDHDCPGLSALSQVLLGCLQSDATWSCRAARVALQVPASQATPLRRWLRDPTLPAGMMGCPSATSGWEPKGGLLLSEMSVRMTLMCTSCQLVHVLFQRPLSWLMVGMQMRMGN